MYRYIYIYTNIHTYIYLSINISMWTYIYIPHISLRAQMYVYKPWHLCPCWYFLNEIHIESNGDNGRSTNINHMWYNVPLGVRWCLFGSHLVTHGYYVCWGVDFGWSVAGSNMNRGQQYLFGPQGSNPMNDSLIPIICNVVSQPIKQSWRVFVPESCYTI